MKSVWREEEGSMALEAAIVLPFFLAFVLLLIGFIRISVTEMALQSAASESVKVVAANMYPMQQLYVEGQALWQASPAGTWLGQAAAQAEAARQTVVDAETFISDYSQWIPGPLVQLAAWEQGHRSALEEWGTQQAGEARAAAERKLAEGALPVIEPFVDKDTLDMSRLRVSSVQFPSLDGTGEANVVVELEYEYLFRVPFYTRTVILHKKAAERAWIGAAP